MFLHPETGSDPSIGSDRESRCDISIGGATDHPCHLRVCFAGCYQISINW